ncbi:glycerol kinase GlpK [Thiomonas sp. FB-Cd]|uniref:glycerol kinase GlpK n=1 Tax=Thiomonas sp. FB-Cd TaxID=1158292 RepID=UPI0004DF4A62|nr:glycerol kinase GlpK [Thiomonas sp. FB-Cd]
MPDTQCAILALDQGTSSTRAILFDQEGAILAHSQRELPQSYPRPGWVEHDARRIWADQRATAREALAGAGARRVMALGLTNQRETTLLWNRATGEPLYPAIVWQDRRTADLCAGLRTQGLEAEVHARTGLLLDPYFSGTKLKWLFDNIPGARAQALKGELAFGTIDSWLLWMLSGGADAATRARAVHATDVSNASRTLLWNIHTQDWDDVLLAAFDIPREVLPQVHTSGYGYAHTAPGLLPDSLPIGAMAGDQQAALFGQACVRAGLAKNTYGTGCFLLLHTGDVAQESQHGLLTTAAAQAAGQGPQYALEGSVFVGGAVVQWLRDGLHAISASAEVEQLAQSVPDSGGVVFVPAFTGLGAPYWRPDATGTITGLTRGTTVAHVARAALESIAFQSAALLESMNADTQAAGGRQVLELRVDGGASSNDLLMQFQADLLGIPVVRPQVLETTALGVAMLAGLSCGVYAGSDAIEALWKPARRFLPQLGVERARQRMQEWEHAVRKALTP